MYANMSHPALVAGDFVKEEKEEEEKEAAVAQQQQQLKRRGVSFYRTRIQVVPGKYLKYYFRAQLFQPPLGIFLPMATNANSTRIRDFAFRVLINSV